MTTKRCGRCKLDLPRSAFRRYEKARDGLQAWCAVCSDTYRREYRAAHGASYHSLSRRRIRYDVLVRYSDDPPACACCREGRFEFLSIDHVDGGGSQHRREVGYGRLYEWLRDNGYPPGFRVLCHNCNQAYGMYGYCPHQSPELAVVARPVDKRTRAGETSRSRILTAFVELTAAGCPTTLDALVGKTGIGKSTVQRHRRSLQREGLWDKQLQSAGVQGGIARPS